MENSKSGSYTNEKTILSNEIISQKYKEPSLLFSTYIGGSNQDEVNGITTDSGGNTYITGCTNSPNFIITNQIIGLQYISNSAIFVLKFNSENKLVYSTIINGDKDDYAYKIAIDKDNCPYIIGTTKSTPTSINASKVYGSELNNTSAIVIAKLTSDGSQLSYLTYITGNGVDEGKNLFFSKSNIYFIGVSNSNNWESIFSDSYNSFGENLLKSNNNIVIGELNSFGNLQGLTTISGNKDIFSNGIYISNSENVFICGNTSSTKLGNISLNKIGFFERDHTSKIVVCKLNNKLNKIAYFTLISGEGDDTCTGITVDRNENVFITGSTKSINYPVVPSENIIGKNNIKKGYLIISKLNSAGLELDYSVLIGGSGSQVGLDIAIDNLNNVTVVGYTDSQDYPCINQLEDFICSKGINGLVSTINRDGTKLLFSSLIGGDGYDYINDLAIDAGNNIAIVGRTTSKDLPLVGDGLGIKNGNINGFKAKIGLNEVNLFLELDNSPSSISLGEDIIYKFRLINKGYMIANNIVFTQKFNTEIDRYILKYNAQVVNVVNGVITFDLGSLCVGEDIEILTSFKAYSIGEVESITTITASNESLIVNEVTTSTTVISVQDYLGINDIKKQNIEILSYLQREEHELQRIAIEMSESKFSNIDINKSISRIDNNLNVIRDNLDDSLEGEEAIYDKISDLAKYDKKRRYREVRIDDNLNFTNEKLDIQEKTLSDIECGILNQGNYISDLINKSQKMDGTIYDLSSSIIILKDEISKINNCKRDNRNSNNKINQLDENINKLGEWVNRNISTLEDDISNININLKIIIDKIETQSEIYKKIDRSIESKIEFENEISTSNYEETFNIYYKEDGNDFNYGLQEIYNNNDDESENGEENNVLDNTLYNKLDDGKAEDTIEKNKINKTKNRIIRYKGKLRKNKPKNNYDYMKSKVDAYDEENYQYNKCENETCIPLNEGEKSLISNENALVGDNLDNNLNINIKEKSSCYTENREEIGKAKKIKKRIPKIINKLEKEAYKEVSSGIIKKNKLCKSVVLIINNNSIKYEDIKIKIINRKRYYNNELIIDLKIPPRENKVITFELVLSIYEIVILGDIFYIDSWLIERRNSYKCNFKSSKVLLIKKISEILI